MYVQDFVHLVWTEIVSDKLNGMVRPSLRRF